MPILRVRIDLKYSGDYDMFIENVPSGDRIEASPTFFSVNRGDIISRESTCMKVFLNKVTPRLICFILYNLYRCGGILSKLHQ